MGASPSSIRVLIVDDSPTMRALIASSLRRTKSIEVVAEAGNAAEAKRAVLEHDPDVVTLDLEMPGLDGAAFLDKLMEHKPRPVIVVSGRDDARTLRGRAFGVLPKSELNLGQGGTEDTPLARMILSTGPGTGRKTRTLNTKTLLCIGSSTGGVDALQIVLKDWPKLCPPTLITQHIGEPFINGFAARLDSICKASVRVAEDGEPIVPGRVYVAPRSSHLEVAGRHRLWCKTENSTPHLGHVPSVDVMFNSLTTIKRPIVAAVLTGMGQDGGAGLAALRRVGAMTCAQDEKTSAIYGMPKAAVESGGAQSVLPLSKIGNWILDGAAKAAEAA